MLTCASFKRASKQSCIDKLNSDDTIFREIQRCKQMRQMSNNYAPSFNRINFVVIPSYIELPCLYQAHKAGLKKTSSTISGCFPPNAKWIYDGMAVMRALRGHQGVRNVSFSEHFAYVLNG